MSAPHPPHQPQPDELKDRIDDIRTAPVDAYDAVIEAYKKDVDRTLLRENLKLTPQQRSEKFASFMKGIYALRGAADPDLKVWR